MNALHYVTVARWFLRRLVVQLMNLKNRLTKCQTREMFFKALISQTNSFK